MKLGQNMVNRKIFFLFYRQYFTFCFYMKLSFPAEKTVLLVIKYLINNKNEWKIKDYDYNICTFSYAMALSILAIWYRIVSKKMFGFLRITFYQVKNHLQNVIGQAIVLRSKEKKRKKKYS